MSTFGEYFKVTTYVELCPGPLPPRDMLARKLVALGGAANH